jgi:DNA-binding MarR family transcriptional regulator
MRRLAAAGAIEQRLRSPLKDTLGVSHDEFLILCLLAERPEGLGLRMTRIAELLGRPKTRLTYQVACLQHAGLVARRSACGDRRGIEVALTEKARRQLEDASAELGKAVTEALVATIGPEQHAAVRDLLTRAEPCPGETRTQDMVEDRREDSAGNAAGDRMEGRGADGRAAD